MVRGGGGEPDQAGAVACGAIAGGEALIWVGASALPAAGTGRAATTSGAAAETLRPAAFELKPAGGLSGCGRADAAGGASAGILAVRPVIGAVATPGGASWLWASAGTPVRGSSMGRETVPACGGTVAGGGASRAAGAGAGRSIARSTAVRVGFNVLAAISADSMATRGIVSTLMAASSGSAARAAARARFNVLRRVEPAAALLL